MNVGSCFWLNAGHGVGGREGSRKLCRGHQGFVCDRSLGNNEFSKKDLWGEKAVARDGRAVVQEAFKVSLTQAHVCATFVDKLCGNIPIC